MCEVAERLTNIGLVQGRTEGMNRMIYALVQDCDLSPDKGAQRLGISVEQLKGNMELAGYTFPI